MMDTLMDNLTEPSSSLSFTSTSHLSNGANSYNVSASSGPESGRSNLEIISLSRLSSNLEKLLLDSDFDCSDVEIVVEGIPVGVHRCILAARSRFFHELFAKGGDGSSKPERKPKYHMNDLVPDGRVGHEAFIIFLSYLYTGKLKPSPQDVSTCVDTSCVHDACRPAVNFAVELMYASSVFQIAELVSLFQRRLLNFVEKALIEDVIPIVQVAFHCQLNLLLTHCIQRVARSDLDNITLEKEAPPEVVDNIKLLRLKSHPNDPSAQVDPVQEKRVRRIHKALDSDDVELLKLLLSESDITLDDANALHYAAAYCDSKIVAEVLELRLANVNLKNARGYTVLHVAAMRREPAVIMSLLRMGACVSDITADGQSTISICRRLTRAKDYCAKTEQGQESNKDRICIDILEREMRRNPTDGDGSNSSMVMADDLHMRLLYLENRVAFARLLFPAEAKLAMKIAHAETTSEFAGLSAPKNTSGTLREVDLNETPIVQNKRLRSRMDALQKTVELGRHYFPHCSEVLDKFLEDDLPDLFYLERGTPEEQKIKRMRFCELKEDVQKAFSKDKAEFSQSVLSSSSSSSSSLKENVSYKASRK
ncbi:BTB/POZ domain and ankyrin repeat-containing protein NPR1 [Magnolia sinica]|uniref:BTB/POZ domain and ankyrin repeat-containing protein NPR1 n=1 Tax=Magnolia sinica TaxID=86752 RepID=UPI00265B6F69|nr:BTB/POZ domain and ankyrin repeat-containing protein NPR1 [Magnolia sinica]